MAQFKVPLNLPHAGTIAGRIAKNIEERLDPQAPEQRRLVGAVRRLQTLLLPCQVEGENPPPPEAEKLRQEAAALARELVAGIEAAGLQGDRLGQCVRNLFECLELGEEGAALSLKAGEDPRSPQRPV